MLNQGSLNGMMTATAADASTRRQTAAETVGEHFDAAANSCQSRWEYFDAAANCCQSRWEHFDAASHRFRTQASGIKHEYV